MSNTTPYIYIHRWDCPHEEVVNGAGDRVDPGLVFDTDYTAIDEEATYACPVCSDPDGSHVWIAIKVPRPVGAAGGANIVTNTNNIDGNNSLTLRPNAHSFTPSQSTISTAGPFNMDTSSLPPPNAPTGPRALTHPKFGPHKPGRRCPEAVPHCHFHYSDPKACHKPVGNCDMAFKAIRSSLYAANKWTGAPLGWNEEHEACIRKGEPVRCALHERFHRDKDRKVG